MTEKTKATEAYSEILRKPFDLMFDKWVSSGISKCKEGKSLVLNFFRTEMGPNKVFELSDEELKPFHDFKAAADIALQSLFFDSGMALKEFYFKVEGLMNKKKNLKQKYVELAEAHTRDDGDLDFESMSQHDQELRSLESSELVMVDWITDEQMEEWKNLLEKKDILN